MMKLWNAIMSQESVSLAPRRCAGSILKDSTLFGCGLGLVGPPPKGDISC